MKKSALFLGFLLLLFCLVKCSGPKECATNKILGDPIFDPSWVGDCVNDSAEGQGNLVRLFRTDEIQGRNEKWLSKRCGHLFW